MQRVGIPNDMLWLCLATAARPGVLFTGKFDLSQYHPIYAGWFSLKSFKSYQRSGFLHDIRHMSDAADQDAAWPDCDRINLTGH